MRKEYIQSAKTELKKFQNRATRRQLGKLPNNEPTKGTTAATRPGERDKF